MGHQLLSAIREHFDRTDTTRSDTKALIERLNESGDFSDLNRGRGLTPHFLARLLKPYGISSRDLKMPDGKVLKGYDRADFDEVFNTYLAGNPISKGNSATKPENIVQNPLYENATQSKGSGTENVDPANVYPAGSGVADQKSVELVEELA